MVETLTPLMESIGWLRNFTSSKCREFASPETILSA